MSEKGKSGTERCNKNEKEADLCVVRKRVQVPKRIVKLRGTVGM
jgi:hypothetical protein